LTSHNLSRVLYPPHRLIIPDLDSSFNFLERCLSQPSYVSGQPDEQAPLNPLDSQVAIIFDLNVLSQIANTSKAIIGVSAMYAWAGQWGSSMLVPLLIQFH